MRFGHMVKLLLLHHLPVTWFNLLQTHLKMLEEPLVKPWHSLFLRVSRARTRTTTSCIERQSINQINQSTFIYLKC